MFRVRSLFDSIRCNMPITASAGTNALGFRKFKTPPVPVTPAVLSSHAVAVVPTFAPMITPHACASCISPELINPSTITIVADDD